MADSLQAMFTDDRLRGETPLRRVQYVMLRMLRVVDHICRRHGIEYWLARGTLLGWFATGGSSGTRYLSAQVDRV